MERRCHEDGAGVDEDGASSPPPSLLPHPDDDVVDADVRKKGHAVPPNPHPRTRSFPQQDYQVRGQTSPSAPRAYTPPP